MDSKRGSQLVSLNLIKDESRPLGLRKVRSAANLQGMLSQREQSNAAAATTAAGGVEGVLTASALSGRGTAGLFRLQRCQSLVGMMSFQGSRSKLPSTSKCLLYLHSSRSKLPSTSECLLYFHSSRSKLLSTSKCLLYLHSSRSSKLQLCTKSFCTWFSEAFVPNKQPLYLFRSDYLYSSCYSKHFCDAPLNDK